MFFFHDKFGGLNSTLIIRSSSTVGPTGTTLHEHMEPRFLPLHGVHVLVRHLGRKELKPQFFSAEWGCWINQGNDFARNEHGDFNFINIKVWICQQKVCICWKHILLHSHLKSRDGSNILASGVHRPDLCVMFIIIIIIIISCQWMYLSNISDFRAMKIHQLTSWHWEYPVFFRKKMPSNCQMSCHAIRIPVTIKKYRSTMAPTLGNYSRGACHIRNNWFGINSFRAYF